MAAFNLRLGLGSSPTSSATAYESAAGSIGAGAEVITGELLALVVLELLFLGVIRVGFKHHHGG